MPPTIRNTSGCDSQHSDVRLSSSLSLVDVFLSAHGLRWPIYTCCHVSFPALFESFSLRRMGNDHVVAFVWPAWCINLTYMHAHVFVCRATIIPIDVRTALRIALTRRIARCPISNPSAKALQMYHQVNQSSSGPLDGRILRIGEMDAKQWNPF